MRLIDDRDASFLGLLGALHAHGGHAWVVGITGTPGSGKSTLVDRLVETYRARGKRVGVIAVDPTSPLSGGALLGDRIRMQRHFLDDGVFIRSLATRGHLGGLSRSAADVIRVLDAAGFDLVLVETVGVGQDELEVARLADTTIVVLAPGLGDDVQASKAGILEVADVFAVNKADKNGADAVVADLEQMIALGSVTAAARRPRSHSAAAAIPTPVAGASEGSWSPPVVKTAALGGEGIAALAEACEAHRAFLDDPERGAARRARRIEQELSSVFRETLLTSAEDRLGGRFAEAVQRIEAGASNPYAEAEALVGALLGPGMRPE